MEMLVTKFSKGKYRNEGELFSEPISKENVKLMGEMIAFVVFLRREQHVLFYRFGIFPYRVHIVPSAPELPIPVLEFHVSPFLVYQKTAFSFQKPHES